MTTKLRDRNIWNTHLLNVRPEFKCCIARRSCQIQTCRRLKVPIVWNWLQFRIFGTDAGRHMHLVKRRTPYPRTWSVRPLLSGQRIQFLQILIQLPKEMVVTFEVSPNFNKCFGELRAVWYFLLICNRSKKFAAQAYIFILYWVELGMGKFRLFSI